MNHPKLLYLLLLALISCQKQTMGQPPNRNGNNTLIMVGQSLTDLRFQLAADTSQTDSSGIAALSRKMSQANFLLNGLVDKMLRTNRHAPTYPPMLKELSNYKDLFTQAKNIKDLDSLDMLISFVIDDLALKYDSRLALSTDNNLELTAVHVRVFKDSTNTELNGYICHVKPEWSLNPDQVETFNPTNNAIMKIAPGRKIFWLEKSGVVLQQKMQKIRLDDDQEVRVDFVTP